MSPFSTIHTTTILSTKEIYILDQAINSQCVIRCNTKDDLHSILPNVIFILHLLPTQKQNDTEGHIQGLNKNTNPTNHPHHTNTVSKQSFSYTQPYQPEASITSAISIQQNKQQKLNNDISDQPTPYHSKLILQLNSSASINTTSTPKTVTSNPTVIVSLHQNKQTTEINAPSFTSSNKMPPELYDEVKKAVRKYMTRNGDKSSPIDLT